MSSRISEIVKVGPRSQPLELMHVGHISPTLSISRSRARGRSLYCFCVKYRGLNVDLLLRFLKQELRSLLSLLQETEKLQKFSKVG